jgi:hypothetical protein
MTLRRLLLGAQRLLAGVVLALSGAYLLIYLYRWEWNRAIISGLFFVAAEVALAASMLLRRLQSLERHLSPTAGQPQAVLGRLRATPVDRPNPFGWLNPRDGRLGVFVPVLLGAGAILSAVAYVVERVAEATAVPVLDRHLATRLGTLAAPPEGLLGKPGPAPGTGPQGQPPPRSSMTLVGYAVAVVALVLMGWLGLDALLDATQTRADPADRPARTTIELVVAQRDATEEAVEAAQALWVGCRSTLGSQATSARVAELEGDHVTLVLEPGIGRLTTRRLTGCLADLRVNHVIADVVSVETVR